MILTCPACGTRYAVKDGAIPEGGRQVRCASCKHSWHQDPEAAADADPEPAQPSLAEDPAAPSPEPHLADPEHSENLSRPVGDHAHPDLEASAYRDDPDPDAHPLPEPGAAHAVEPPEHVGEEMVHDEPATPPEPEAILPPAGELHYPPASQAVEEQGWSDEPVHTPEDDPFTAYVSADEPDEPRRRGLVGLLLALLLIALAVAGFWFLAPAEWKQRLGIAEVSGSPVMVQLDETNRRTLASGNELLEVSGKVINPTDQPQRVPQIEAMLRTYSQKVVYRWTIPPPAPVLAPGGSATFNSAELLSIPADAACLSVLAREAKGAKLEPCTPASQQVAAQPS